jgi:hypothetical protein
MPKKRGVKRGYNDRLSTIDCAVVQFCNKGSLPGKALSSLHTQYG